MKERLKRILIKLHLLGLAKWMLLKFKWCISIASANKLRRAFHKDFDAFFGQMEHVAPSPGGIVVVGILCTPHKPTLMPFLSQVQQACPGRQIILMDESRKKQEEPPFMRLELPRSVPSRFDSFLELEVTKDVLQLLEEKQFLQEAVENLMVRHSNITLSYARVLVCRTYLLYSRMIDLWEPSCVMIWSEYNALHAVCTHVCREKNVDPVFLEFGVLPGTFALERGGQMGESEPAVNWQAFLRLPVSDAQLQQADKILEYLRSSKLNRNAQPKNDDMSALKKRLIPGRPIILFAGQKDFDSGMVPYTEHTRQYHSPCFASSVEATEYLAEIAAENQWNFIFKPHPGMVTRYKKSEYSPNTIYVDSIDLNDLIDMVDVVVTIMSQTAYVSLIRNKAVVMVGYNQLRGKGCTYEAFRPESIEEQLKAAIENGYTAQQKESFRKHTAQLLNYYLFDDLKERPVRYGRSVESVF